LHCREIVEVPIPKTAIFVPMFTDGKEKLKRKMEGGKFFAAKARHAISRFHLIFLPE